MHQLLSRLLLSVALLAPLAQAAELRLELPQGNRSWSTEQLLGHPQAQQIEIAADVAYKRAMSYRAVPLAALLDGVQPGDHLQAVALDGFAAELPAAPLLATQGARAWLAVEDPVQPWPALAAGKPALGLSIWCGRTPRPRRSARSSGRFRWLDSVCWPRWRSASRRCCQRRMPAPRCRRGLRCSRRTVWPVTASMARGIRSSGPI